MFGGKTIKKDYQSDIDAFFHDYDAKRTDIYDSRQKEIDKHAPIFDKRDNPREEEKSEIWEGF